MKFKFSKILKNIMKDNFSIKNIMYIFGRNEYWSYSICGWWYALGEFFKVSNIGNLNVHSKQLLFFQIMNVIKWSLMHNVKPIVTVHMISEGIKISGIYFHNSILVKKIIISYTFKNE